LENGWMVLKFNLLSFSKVYFVSIICKWKEIGNCVVTGGYRGYFSSAFGILFPFRTGVCQFLED